MVESVYSLQWRQYGQDEAQIGTYLYLIIVVSTFKSSFLKKLSLKNCFTRKTYGKIVKENHVELCLSDEWVADFCFCLNWLNWVCEIYWNFFQMDWYPHKLLFSVFLEKLNVVAVAFGLFDLLILNKRLVFLKWSILTKVWKIQLIMLTNCWLQVLKSDHVSKHIF